MKVPLLVTEFSTLLIRRRALDTASGRLAPSRSPQSPPIARPECQKETELIQSLTGSSCGQGAKTKYVPLR